MREYELKARLAGGLDAFRRRLREAGWSLAFRGEMSDRRLDTPDGALEARDEVVRIRRYVPETGDSVAVLGWKGPARTEEGFKLREEVECRVGDAETAREILARLGYSAVTLAIDRAVERYEKAEVTLRIERYPRMDVLVEVEGDPVRVRARLEELGLPRDAWKPWPLDEFVRRFERRTGGAARLARGTEGETAP